MNMQCPACNGSGQIFDLDCLRHDADLHRLLDTARNNLRNVEGYAAWLRERVRLHKKEIQELRCALDEARSVRRDALPKKKARYDDWVIVG